MQHLIGVEKLDDAGNVISTQGYYRMLQDRLRTANEMIAYWKAEPDTPDKEIRHDVTYYHCTTTTTRRDGEKISYTRDIAKGATCSGTTSSTIRNEFLRMERVRGTKEIEHDRWKDLKKSYENQITSVKEDIEAMYKELLGLDRNAAINIEELLREDAEGLSEVSRYLDSFQYALKEAKEAQDTINLANGGYDRIEALLTKETKIKDEAYKAYEALVQARNQQLLETYIQKQEEDFQEDIRKFLKSASLTDWLKNNLLSAEFKLEIAQLTSYTEIEKYFIDENKGKIQGFQKARVQTAINKIQGIQDTINDYITTLTTTPSNDANNDKNKIDELNKVTAELSTHIKFLTQVKAALSTDENKRILLQSGTEEAVALLQAILEGQESIAELNIDEVMNTTLKALTEVDASTLLLDIDIIDELNTIPSKSAAYSEWEMSKKLFDLFGKTHKEYVTYARSKLLEDWNKIEARYLDAGVKNSSAGMQLDTIETIHKYKKAIQELVGNTRLIEGTLIDEYAQTKIMHAILFSGRANNSKKNQFQKKN